MWARALAWLLVIGIAVSLVGGYAGLAYFLAERLLATVAIVGAFYLLIAASDALFADLLTTETPRGRAIAINFGLDPRNVGLIGVLIAGAVRVLLVVCALVLLLGPWQVSTASFIDRLKGITVGFEIGGITFSFGTVLGAVAVLVLILLVTRALQRWLERQFLPHTALDPSLQLSIVTIFGYLGVIAAIAFALAQLGIDLQKIALIAGALSVGIGFGLQAIVSNFVSGLILLAERPIRVGDQIVVKGEEGKVRRISVRATEIETVDQGSVIVPNSELITGVVKNWTHANTWGRIVIRVGVGYDSDPEAGARHPCGMRQRAQGGGGGARALRAARLARRQRAPVRGLCGHCQCQQRRSDQERHPLRDPEAVPRSRDQDRLSAARGAAPGRCAIATP